MLTTLQKKEFSYSEYDYNIYIDIFDIINCFRLPRKGINYQSFGHIWSNKFKVCLEKEKHKGIKAENKIYLRKVSAS